MHEAVINSVLWGTGAVVVLTVIVVVLALLSWGISRLAGRSIQGLVCFVRYETARYWVERMEREGLTAPQDEYRRMVRERNLRSPADFRRLDMELESERVRKALAAEDAAT